MSTTIKPGDKIISIDKWAARVAELESANEDLRRWVAHHEDERAAVTRALKDATDAAGATSMHGQGAAAQPKPRDEFVAPPDDAARDAEDMAQRDKFEAAIRADERARTERAIAAWLNLRWCHHGKGTNAVDAAFQTECSGIMFVIERSDYPRGAPAPEPADPEHPPST